MTRCLVTGGAGAVGSNLVARLMADRHEVTVLDDLSSGHRSLIPPGARFVEGSIGEDRVLDAAFEGKPEWVFHLAALFANQNSVDHPERDLQVNGTGTLKIVARAARAGAARLLYTSSSCVYGRKSLMSESDAQLQPDTPYAITKLLGEHYCRFWSDQHGLFTAIVRLFNTYGPHEFPGKYRNVVPNFIRLAMHGKPLPITGTGEETRDFNFVGDVVDCILTVMRGATQPAEIYNIASGSETRIADLAKLIIEMTGSKAGVEFTPRRGWDHVVTRRGDPAKFVAAFGPQPRTSLADGVALTYAWLKSVDA